MEPVETDTLEEDTPVGRVIGAVPEVLETPVGSVVGAVG